MWSGSVFGATRVSESRKLFPGMSSPAWRNVYVVTTPSKAYAKASGQPGRAAADDDKEQRNGVLAAGHLPERTRC